MALEHSLALRQANLGTLSGLGFRAASHLPVERHVGERLRPASEIASRLLALDALFTWVSLPEAQASSARLRAHVERDGLAAWMAGDERAIWGAARDEAHAAHRDTIGWKLENLWPLAWALGFPSPPSPDGEPVADDITDALLFEFLPGLDTPLAAFLGSCALRSLAEVVALEDLFYCAHNAARSAQLGADSAPPGFDPIAGTGVIHERRHALTWCLSPGVAWDDTDLST